MKNIHTELLRYTSSNIHTEGVVWPCFDTCIIENGPVYHDFFQKPVGMSQRGPIGVNQRGPIGVSQRDKVKTYEDTSMYIPGSFPLGNEFYVIGLGVYFVPNVENYESLTRENNIDDVLKVLGMGYCSFQVGDRKYCGVAPLAMAVPPFPMYWARDDEKLDELLRKGGSVEGAGVIKQRGFEIVPTCIQANQSFVVTIQMVESFKLHAPGKLGVVLDGYLMRSSY